jgi:hypothetical protein
VVAGPAGLRGVHDVVAEHADPGVDEEGVDPVVRVDAGEGEPLGGVGHHGGVGEAVRDGTPGATARVLVQVRPDHHRQPRSGQLLLEEDGLAGAFGRVGGQVGSGDGEPGRPDPALGEDGAPQMPARRQRVLLAPGAVHLHPQAGQQQVAQRGQAARRDHQAEPVGQGGALVPPAEPTRRLLHDHHVRLQTPDRLGQRVDVVPLAVHVVRQHPQPN